LSIKAKDIKKYVLTDYIDNRVIKVNYYVSCPVLECGMDTTLEDLPTSLKESATEELK